MNIHKLQNIVFQGYTNIISLQNAPIDDKYITYLSAKLDNDGSKDLDKFQEICKLKNLQPEGGNNDVLTLVYVYDKAKMKDSIYFQDKLLYWGDELKDFSEKHSNKMMSEDDYKELEKFHMKVYTFLADITKRMAKSSFNNEDDNLSGVIKKLFVSLYKAVKCEQNAFYLLRAGCMKITPFQSTSEGFNKAIVYTMGKFFK